MTPESVVDIGRSALEITLVMISILLIPALVVGLLISMFQAATQINEQTLSFIPKLLVVFASILVAGSWMLNMLVNYSINLFTNIPSLIG